jgi:hypothetical protein
MFLCQEFKQNLQFCKRLQSTENSGRSRKTFRETGPWWYIDHDIKDRWHKQKNRCMDWYIFLTYFHPKLCK